MVKMACTHRDISMHAPHHQNHNRRNLHCTLHRSCAWGPLQLARVNFTLAVKILLKFGVFGGKDVGYAVLIRITATIHDTPRRHCEIQRKISRNAEESNFFVKKKKLQR